MVAKIVVIVKDSTIYPTISCDELNQHLYNVFTSSTANLEHHLGIPVLIAAGSQTIDHLSSIADGQGIKIRIFISNCQHLKKPLLAKLSDCEPGVLGDHIISAN